MLARGAVKGKAILHSLDSATTAERRTKSELRRSGSPTAAAACSGRPENAQKRDRVNTAVETVRVLVLHLLLEANRTFSPLVSLLQRIARQCLYTFYYRSRMVMKCVLSPPLLSYSPPPPARHARAHLPSSSYLPPCPYELSSPPLRPPGRLPWPPE